MMIISLYTYISNQPRNPIFIAQNYSTVPITIVSAQLSTLNFCIFLLQIGWLKHPMVQRIYAPKKKLQNFPKLFRVMLFEYSRNLSPTSASKFASLGNQTNSGSPKASNPSKFCVSIFYGAKVTANGLFWIPKALCFGPRVF